MVAKIGTCSFLFFIGRLGAYVGRIVVGEDVFLRAGGMGAAGAKSGCGKWAGMAVLGQNVGKWAENGVFRGVFA